ncbi:Zn-ribbon domain-containing OB-fold protein [Ramlibacter rhizophilus]|uniref:DNA-binding protein n=1 Tax=Ramlibacter rhizophilus TaxID=1781167 RepID=A0A4Z0BKH9_9BURK|nr:OB-fold domain-containing protein [Ramlibacter rhizophilus]TFY99822.1 DNA-binding protein [Ramlibacter rhizophilus]
MSEKSPSTAPARRLPPESGFTDTAPFWQGTREGRLMLQYCTETQRFQHYPRPLSLYTGRRTLGWKEVSGFGTVYAHTVLRTPGLGADGRLPCVLALVELDEGVRILANLPGTAPGEIGIGQRVRLTWDELGGDARYPAFTAM